MSTPRLLAAMITMALASTAPASEPTSWRAGGSGAYPDASPPLQWGTSKNVIWKTEMPNWSNSSPIIIDDKVFVCADDNVLVCVSAVDGKVLWTSDSTDVSDAKPDKHNATGYSTPTPTTDGKHVFAVFGTGVVAAYDTTGKRIWAKAHEQPKARWGHSASPLLADGKLIVHINDVVALDPATGKELWRTPAQPKWGTSTVVELDGAEVIITPSGSFIRASDGKQLARTDKAKAEYSQPIVHAGVVYFISDGSSTARAVELPASADEPFTLTNVWTQNLPNTSRRHYGSAVIHDGLIYTIARNETYHVLDAKTGRVITEVEKLLGGGGTNSAYPSIALAGGKVFVSSQAGKTVVIEPGRTHKVLATNSLDPFRSSPVFVGNRVYIRTMKHLYCIGSPS